MATVLKLEGLAKRFHGLVAVSDLSIDVEERTIHALIGPNGSGKSTTVNLITGAYPSSGGRVFHRGTEITNRPAYEIAQTGINRTFQNLKLYRSMTVLENLMVGMHVKTTQGFFSFLVNPMRTAREEREMREKALEVLTFLGLYKLRGEYVNNISYGRQKMTELGRSLMNDPKLLFLDEPAAGLNPSERVEFIDILLKVFDSGIDLFLIEHNMDVVMNISHMITVINFGMKIAEATAKEIQTDETVIQAYLGNKYRKRVEADAEH
ncbi:MAG: ABC transporter ATP-binding protein [Christensenellaceae bacterium]|nr:ABC transporter ATP-binding protein [Christensenellaceae bacterium]MEA5066791.1 ABC transporter ATP-binding protein [Eubacteriales bacterium]MEA5069634.1 ABC transporter ATP-binding protein [Christensenellaceae bacterium]